MTPSWKLGGCAASQKCGHFRMIAFFRNRQRGLAVVGFGVQVGSVLQQLLHDF